MTHSNKPAFSTGMFVRKLISYVQYWWTGDALCWILFHTWPIFTGLLAKEFFDELQGTVPERLGAATIAALALALGVTRAGIVVLASAAGGNQRFRIRALLWNNLLRRIYSLPGACALPEPTGEVLSTFRDDVEYANEAVDVVFDTVAAALFACAALGILVSVDSGLALLVFVPVAMVIGIAHAVRAALRGIRERSRQSAARVIGAIGEVLNAAEAISVSNAQGTVLSHLGDLCDARRQAALRERWQTILVDAAFKQIANLGTGLMLLAASSRTRGGGFAVGDFALFATYLTQFSDFTGFLGYLINTYRQSGVSFGRMVRLLQGSPAADLVAYADLPLGRINKDVRYDKIATAVAKTDCFRETLVILEISGLTCVYETGGGIHEASFSIKRGSITALTGRIGSGKTTLLRAILGLLPVSSGKIIWNGRIVGAPDEFMVPPRVSYTPQAPLLFSGNLRDNIALGKGLADHALYRSIQDAMLSDEVAAMTYGLDTPVGVRGTRLSGGQAQRVAVARIRICFRTVRLRRYFQRSG